jgi:uncharacterized protein
MRKAAVAIILLITFRFCSGQDEIMDSFYHQFDVSEKKVSYREYTTNSNEAKQVVSVLFLFYKEFISSQDIDACVFTPSCSVYAMESIKTYGLIEGLFNALDRLTRCHGFAKDYYHTHPQTHKFYDPIENKK